jgi:hypothetical protein
VKDPSSPPRLFFDRQLSLQLDQIIVALDHVTDRKRRAWLVYFKALTERSMPSLRKSKETQ